MKHAFCDVPIKSTTSHIAGLAVGLVAVSFAGILIRLCGMNPFAISALRTIAGGLILLPFALKHMMRDFPRLTRREWLLLIGAGLLMAIHFITWVAAVFITKVGSAMMIFGAQPIFAGIVAHFFLGEKFRRSAAVALAVALVGIGIVAANDYTQKPAAAVGVLLALVGAITMGSILCVAKALRRKMHIMSYACSMYLIAGLLTAPGLLFITGEIHGYTGGMWFFLALIIIVPQLTGHTLLNWATKYFKAFTVNLSILIEPILATVLAIIILGERQNFIFLIGGVFILGGITYHLICERRTRRPAQGPVTGGP